MSFTSNPGPLTEWFKEAGLISGGLSAAGTGVKTIGKGVWNVAGHVAPHPLARAGVLGVATVGVGTHVPHLAGRIS